MSNVAEENKGRCCRLRTTKTGLCCRIKEVEVLRAKKKKSWTLLQARECSLQAYDHRIAGYGGTCGVLQAGVR